jgi:hypothetical protein
MRSLLGSRATYSVVELEAKIVLVLSCEGAGLRGNIPRQIRFIVCKDFA